MFWRRKKKPAWYNQYRIVLCENEVGMHKYEVEKLTDIGWDIQTWQTIAVFPEEARALEYIEEEMRKKVRRTIVAG